MQFRPTVLMRLLVAVLILVSLSVTVTWMMPGDVLARPVFQSPLTPSVTRTATSTSTRPVTGTAPITNPQPVTPTVSAAPPITATRPITPAVAPIRPPEQRAATVAPAAPGVPGFLPPPTLSAPTGKLQPLLPGPGQPLVAPPAPTLAPRPPDAASSDALLLARLIDEGIVALSYLWLCCGVLVLAVAALVIVWLARRSTRA
ncbi:MAG: hypothetical protein MUC51_11425 [Anaerolineae bacterium]|nr:hypothetical protein [Anaerolineae bacterium]